MIAELGHFALILAFCVAIAQSIIPSLGVYKSSSSMMNFAARAAKLQAGLLVAAFLALTVIFIQSDYSVKLAATHSHSAKPLLYKISGVWGNHEGSILLWMVMLAGLGLLGFKKRRK